MRTNRRSVRPCAGIAPHAHCAAPASRVRRKCLASSLGLGGVQTQGCNERLNVAWQFRGPLEPLAGERMSQFEALRMQCLALECSEHGDQRGGCTTRKAQASAVNGIADDWRLDVCEVHANLMCAAGLERDAQERMPAKSLEHAVVRPRLASLRSNGHALAIAPMTGDRSVDTAAGAQD